MWELEGPNADSMFRKPPSSREGAFYSVLQARGWTVEVKPYSCWSLSDDRHPCYHGSLISSSLQAFELRLSSLTASVCRKDAQRRSGLSMSA